MSIFFLSSYSQVLILVLNPFPVQTSLTFNSHVVAVEMEGAITVVADLADKIIVHVFANSKFLMLSSILLLILPFSSSGRLPNQTNTNTNTTTTNNNNNNNNIADNTTISTPQTASLWAHTQSTRRPVGLHLIWSGYIRQSVAANYADKQIRIRVSVYLQLNLSLA